MPDKEIAEIPETPTVNDTDVIPFTVGHARMLAEVHEAVVSVAAMAKEAGPVLEGLTKSGPMGMMLGSLLGKRP